MTDKTGTIIAVTGLIIAITGGIRPKWFRYSRWRKMFRKKRKRKPIIPNLIAFKQQP